MPGAAKQPNKSPELSFLIRQVENLAPGKILDQEISTIRNFHENLSHIPVSQLQALSSALTKKQNEIVEFWDGKKDETSNRGEQAILVLKCLGELRVTIKLAELVSAYFEKIETFSNQAREMRWHLDFPNIGIKKID